MSKRRVVILGGGFGGFYVARKLAKRANKLNIEVVLVDQRNYFLFTPLLHEVATATIDDRVPVEPLYSVVKPSNSKFEVGKVQKINFNSKKVELDNQTIDYDFLVLALGAETNTYGVPGVDENAYKMKNLAQAVEIKHKIIDLFEAAAIEVNPEKRKALLSIAIIGAGPTGIELAGEISDFVADVTQYNFQSIKPSEVNLTIVQSGSVLLPANNPKLGSWVESYLKKTGWDIKFDCRVVAIEPGKIKFADEQECEASLIVWAAGVKPAAISFDKEVAKDKSGRILVNEYLQLEENVFALGDIANNSERNWPMLAQVAVTQADVVIKNLIKVISGKSNLKQYSFFNKGFLVSVGKWNAVGEIAGVPIKGWWVWILWHAVYFMKFASNSKRFKVLFDWMLNVFRPRDISKY